MFRFRSGFRLVFKFKARPNRGRQCQNLISISHKISVQKARNPVKLVDRTGILTPEMTSKENEGNSAPPSTENLQCLFEKVPKIWPVCHFHDVLPEKVCCDISNRGSLGEKEFLTSFFTELLPTYILFIQILLINTASEIPFHHGRPDHQLVQTGIAPLLAVSTL